MNHERSRLLRVNTDRIFLRYTKMVVACQKVLPGRHPSDVIQYLRVGEGLTLDQVAERLGVHKATVNRWTPPEIVGMQHYTEGSLRASKAGARAMNAGKTKKRGHIWNKYDHALF